MCCFDPPGTGIITTGVCVVLIRQGQVSLRLVCVCCFDPPGTGIITTGVCVVLIRQGQVSLRLVCVSF